MNAHPGSGLMTRVATPHDAGVIAAILAEAFQGYRAWAPPDWSPPLPSNEEETLLAEALSRPGVWCLLGSVQGSAVGHVALSPFTMVEPEPPPSGTTNLWQLFVRPDWQGRGVAARLIGAAVAEARRQGFARLRLWTPQGAARARRFYEREGWTETGNRRAETALRLPVVQYARAVVEGA